MNLISLRKSLFQTYKNSPRNVTVFVSFVCLIAFHAFIFNLFLEVFRQKSRIINKLYLPFERISVDSIGYHAPSAQQHDFKANLSSFVDTFVIKYCKWHSKKRASIQQGHTDLRQQRVLLYRGYHTGGIGDHIRGTLYSYLVAVFTGRLFLIDLNIPFPIHLVWENALGSNFTYDPSIFRLDDDSGNILPTAINDSGLSKFEEYMSDSRHVVQINMRTFVVHSIMDQSAEFPKLKTWREEGNINHFRPTGAILGPFVMKALFRTSPELRRRLRKRWPFPPKSFIGLHARLGHGLGEHIPRFNASMSGTSTRELAFCIGYAGGRHAAEKNVNRIFISSDTRDLSTEIKRGVYAALPDATIKVARGSAVHTSQLPDLRLSKKRKREAFFRAFVDLGILSGAKSVTYFRSGYIDVAQWLGAITDGKEVTVGKCVEFFKLLR